MKKIILKIAGFFLFLPYLLYANNNFLSTLRQEVEEQTDNASKEIAGIIYVSVGSLGIVYVLLCLTIYALRPEMIKDNIKFIIVLAVILAIVFGISLKMAS